MNMFYVHLLLLNPLFLKALVVFERRVFTSVGFFSKVAFGTAEGLLYFINTYILQFNPLKPELNPICCLLALLAHHFLHVSRIRVKSLTLRLLMLYIYIWRTYS